MVHLEALFTIIAVIHREGLPLHRGVPESSMRIAQARDQDLSIVNILDSSSPSSRPGPLQEDGLTRHEEFDEDLKATKTGVHCMRAGRQCWTSS
jgi:hypothetical protein